MNLEKTAYSLLKTWIMMRKCKLSTMERRLTSLAITSDSEDQDMDFLTSTPSV